MDENKRKGIIVAGSLIADVFYRIDSYPKEGMLTNVRDLEGHVGGSGNLILDLAKLDSTLPIEVSAIVGKDERGDMLVNKLNAFSNIYLEHIRRNGDTSVTMVMNAQDTKQRTFFFVPAASDQYDMTYIDWETLKGRIFHLEYLLLMAKVDAEDSEYGTHAARILHEAQERGMKTSIDIVSEQSMRAKKIVTCALKYTDYCAINEVEAEAVTGVDLTSTREALAMNYEKALARLHELGVKEWAVIHAPSCSYGLDCKKNKIVISPSLKLPEGYIKGTNGAGDAFCSGILYAAHEGYDMEAALELAAACAACSLSEENGHDGMRSYGEVLKIRKKYSN